MSDECSFCAHASSQTHVVRTTKTGATRAAGSHHNDNRIDLVGRRCTSAAHGHGAQKGKCTHAHVARETRLIKGSDARAAGRLGTSKLLLMKLCNTPAQQMLATMGHLTVPMTLCWLLVGQHVEPSLADSSLTHPMVASGGAACTDEWDCSLGGECTAGVCVCDHWCVCCWLLAPIHPTR